LHEPYKELKLSSVRTGGACVSKLHEPYKELKQVVISTTSFQYIFRKPFILHEPYKELGVKKHRTCVSVLGMRKAGIAILEVLFRWNRLFFLVKNVETSRRNLQLSVK
jgi:hypothetical protein